MSIRHFLTAVASALAMAAAPAAGAMFTNPLVPSGPDPWLKYYEGNYYLAATT